MLDLGPSAAILISFIGTIGSILAVYAGTHLRSRTEAGRRYPGLG